MLMEVENPPINQGTDDMAKAIAAFEGGVTERRQAAVREDGVVFYRSQERDPRYGYRWSKWRRGQTLGENARQNISSLRNGFAELTPADPRYSGMYRDGKIVVRLPG